MEPEREQFVSEQFVSEQFVSERFLIFCLHNIGCIVIFAQIDYLLRYMKVMSRWCQLCAIGNGIIVACTWHDVVSCIQNHDKSSSPPRYPYTESIVLSLYLYQNVVGMLRDHELLYHAFVLISTPICYHNNNKTTSLLYFFCNGYPSLIDYTMQSMVKNGIVENQTMKTVSTAMKNYVRKPGANVVASLLLHDAFRGRNMEYGVNANFTSNILLSFMVYYKYGTSRTITRRLTNGRKSK